MAERAHADLIMSGGRVLTLDPAQPEAEAVACAGGRILQVGTAAEVARHRGADTVQLDLEGQLVVPGFIDAHCHLLWLGQALAQLRLGEARAWDEIVQQVRVAAAAAPPGAWIVGRGWHQELWREPCAPAVQGLPTHHALSRAAPANPVLLIHQSEHLALANASAMQAAGVGRASADPAGGRLLRDPAGALSGVFLETAMTLLTEAQQRDERAQGPAAHEAKQGQALARAAQECLRHGVTSVHEAGLSLQELGLLERAAQAGRLGVRVWAMLREPSAVLAARLPALDLKRARGDRLRVGGIKHFADGAIGTRGAWLLEPYADLPESRGLCFTPLEEIRAAAALALAHDLQLCTHAIGDRANREILDLYEEALQGDPRGRERRWRIEHAQHLHPDDIPRFGALGVVASMQAVHAVADGPWLHRRLGPARVARGTYAWRSLLDAGARFANGTDAPIDSVDPLRSFRALVTREMASGEPFLPAQRLTREEALRACTTWAAWAAFEEGDKGALRPGMLADMAVLSHDIMRVPAEQLADARVRCTLLGGEIVYAEDGGETPAQR